MMQVQSVTIPHCRIEGFLTPDERHRMLGFCILREPGMIYGSVSPAGEQGRPNWTYRKSRVTFDTDPIWPFFEPKLRDLQPFLCSTLHLDRFNQGMIERQLVVHTDGDYFRAHNDIGTPVDPSYSRVISWVYYLNDGYYSGGELKIWEGVAGESPHKVIQPVDNSIVFFPSYLMHEVVDVRGSGKRYSVSGWYHRI